MSRLFILLLSLLCVSGGVANIGRAAPAREVHGMSRLHIALHDGFRGNHVVIAVDKKVVFDRTGVTTDLRISRADAIDVDVAAPSAVVAVSVNPGAFAGEVTVDVAKTPFLAVDLLDRGDLRFNQSAEPFAYL
jgi:membrane-associated protease RseP (regulator of RpoE activity)